MHDFESLVQELLSAKPEFDRERLMQRVEDKKRTVGAGYLTDQGALFLVAGEMGVSLRKENTTSSMRIGDVYIGANDITVLARVLSVYPTASYNRKDGGAGRYMRLVLFDAGVMIRLTVWDDRLEQSESLNLVPDTPVRVAGAYVKQGLDGKPSLNLGRKGSIERLTDQSVVQTLPRISSLAERLAPITEEKQFVALEFTVVSEARYSEFVRSDGSAGSMVQFGVSGENGKPQARVVIWSPSARPELGRGQRIVVTNVRSKKSQSGEFEIHGDAGSAVIQVEDGAGPAIVARMAALVEDGPTTMAIVVEKDGGTFALGIPTGAGLPPLGALVSVPSAARDVGRASSLPLAQDDSFPSLEALSTKISEVKEENATIMIDVIALSYGNVGDVTLRDGTTVRRGELVVGDETGEIKLVCWRDAADAVSGLKPGDRFRVVGAVQRRTKLGAWILEYTKNSAVVRQRKD